MIEINEELLKKPDLFLYIQTPFCGTCHVAKSMLNQIESAHNKHIFYEMNASLYPEFMQEAKVESVPCLLIKKDNEIKDKIYTFYSIPNIYTYIVKYNAKILTQN